MFILPLAKLDITGARLGSKRFNFFGDISVDIQLVTSSLWPNISKLSIGEKAKKNCEKNSFFVK